MDAKEGMAGRGEHRISVVENAGGSGERVGTGIYQEEATSPAIEPIADERWTSEVQEKIARAFKNLPRRSKPSGDDEKEPKICKFAKHFPPRAVAIGPFHRSESTMSIADEEKWLIVHLMNRLYGLDLARRLAKMENQAAAAFKCYSDSDISQSFGSKDDEKRFAEILLLDSYFILFMLTFSEILRRLMLTKPDSPTSSTPSTENPPLQLVMTTISEVLEQRDKIALDLLIVDNQIPFFVIEELFEELKLGKQPLRKYALDFFEIIRPWSTQGREVLRNSPPEFLHLLDLFHWSRVPKKKYSVDSSSHDRLVGFYKVRYTPTATELRESATIFEKKTSGSPLDITFRRGRLIPYIGVLKIPKLHIHDYSSFVFHNVIAFETQYPSRGRCAIAFAAFMRNLLQSEEDVKLLRRRGILASSSMTDGDIVDFFKCLSRLTEHNQMPRDLHALYDQVLSHHNRRKSRFCGSIILRYFPNPLVTLSVFGAFVLFVLTLLQTIYSIVDYYHN